MTQVKITLDEFDKRQMRTLWRNEKLWGQFVDCTIDHVRDPTPVKVQLLHNGDSVYVVKQCYPAQIYLTVDVYDTWFHIFRASQNIKLMFVVALSHKELHYSENETKDDLLKPRKLILLTEFRVQRHDCKHKQIAYLENDVPSLRLRFPSDLMGMGWALQTLQDRLRMQGTITHDDLNHSEFRTQATVTW